MKDLLLLIGTLFFALQGSAQCTGGAVAGFTIHNQRNCDVELLIETTDCCSPVVNYNTLSITLIANQIWTVPSGYNINFCGVGGDVLACLLKIDGVDLVAGGICQTANSVCWGSGSPGFNCNGTTAGGTVPGGVLPPCNSPITWSMSWFSSGITIN